MIATRETLTDHRKTSTGKKLAFASIERLLVKFDSISLPEMQNVSLLDRMDTKYVMGMSQFYTVLEAVQEQYRVLCVNQTRLNHYQTIYFDTPNFTLYHQHHNQLRSRYKVRARKYIDSNLTFFEVKRKTNRDRTVKTRLQIPDVVMQLNGQIDEFVDTCFPFTVRDLEPKLWNQFVRITLVSKHHPERLTIDLNLEFGWGEAYGALPGIVIAEVKQENTSQPSDFVRQMRQFGIRPTPFSKYCIGVCTLYNSVKSNYFKPQLRLVGKVMQEELAHGSIY
ncbi:MAG TPA: polyphosphate polymerase domain-containing protein, partial [Oculatellaceae cyanobacterium]